MRRLKSKKYYLMLLIVVVTWGFDPIVNRYLYGYYSAAALSSLSTFASALLFLFLARKQLHLLSRQFFRISLPICLANSLACVLQRIGLQYTTPSHYAFLEHLSCAAVPLILFLCFRRRPRPIQLISALLCLIGCLLLTGVILSPLSFGIGDILCGAAGLLLGFGIAATSECTQGLDIKLFTALHMCTYFITSLSLAIALHFIKVNGAPIERIEFSFSPLALAAAILFGLLTVGICWLLRNEATRHIHPTAVAVISPFAAVLTALISVLGGMERISLSLAIACVLIPLAAILAGLGDRPRPKEAASHHGPEHTSA
ncbi:MAG: DMT family transporter [Clostridia bacterium]|nr:DMT family transporter [Clostridia bacterium]